MKSNVHLLFGEPETGQDKQITFLYPLMQWYPMLGDSITSIISQNLVADYEIIVLFVIENSPRDQAIIDDINRLGSEKIRLYGYEGTLTKNELYTLGFHLSAGKWISLVEDNYIFLPGGLEKIDRIISREGYLTDKISYLSTWTLNLRVEYQNTAQLESEINHRLTRVTENLEKMNLVKLTDKNFWTYGGFGINVPQRGSLYLKEAFMKTGGFKDANHPLENVFLVKEMENQGEYKTYLSIIPYGIFVSMDSMFKTRENLLTAFHIWMNYVDGRIEALCLPRFVKKRRRKYLKYKQVKFFMDRHKSLNMSLEDFGLEADEKPNMKRYTISYVLSNWRYKQWVDRQYAKNERIMKG